MKTDWKEIWKEDKNSILATMLENLSDDLRVGYSMNGKSVREQMEVINLYFLQTKSELNELEKMEVDKANKWAYHDLKKRGAIE